MCADYKQLRVHAQVLPPCCRCTEVSAVQHQYQGTSEYRHQISALLRAGSRSKKLKQQNRKESDQTEHARKKINSQFTIRDRGSWEEEGSGFASLRKMSMQHGEGVLADSTRTSAVQTQHSSSTTSIDCARRGWLMVSRLIREANRRVSAAAQHEDELFTFQKTKHSSSTRYR